MRSLKETWRAKRFGIKIDGIFMTNLRFADDILLLGRTRAQVKHVLEDLSRVAAKVGLGLHSGKTQIISNARARKGFLRQSHVKVGEGNVEVLSHDSGTAYLGRFPCFDEFHDSAISHRLDKGWSAFGKFRK
eukprot:5500975-Pyramimonas_sp.AAC.1